MAKSSNNMVMFFNLVLVLSLLLIMSMAEARLFGGIGKRDATPECDTVIGVSSGDTCFKISQFFNLTADEFLAINPNLNCSSLFVGQWLCVEGTAN
ncbi:Peptidoglycan-binding Lysin subgroup [Cinnamomum micranthum f. kanehirae]|uniref:Peptidoglycan-binding Lysin subgroup n=1 Tax=Cinnamomum micranthum f. kanehirae TaxID=337451 RepID=A0A3S3N8P0_9MAGN|nr:Peptidoglycan-binding Lysin subgroup [Cinnamomum micranthum f. kanehirae]